MKKKLIVASALGLLSAAMVCASMQGVGKTNAIFFNDIAYNDGAYLERAQKLNIEIANEGTTLLKNEDNVLPLDSSIQRISVFGKASTNLQMGGGGSGSGSVSQGITKIDLQKSLTDAGYDINPELTSFYSSNTRSGSGRKNGNSGWKGISEATVGETPIASYDEKVMNSIYDYNDAAIMVLARGGTEGADCKTYDARDFDSDPISDRHYLELSKNEEDLLDMIEENFDTVIVLINSGNAFECARLESDPQVNAVIWMGTPGANGTAAIGKILKGEVCPSGRTVDTWERDFTKNPTFQNFADNLQTNIDETTGIAYPQDTMFNPDGSPVHAYGSYKTAPVWDNEDHKVVKYGLNGVRPSAYVSYEEGIYMDYRYYETAYSDIAKDSQSEADAWYEGDFGVCYPFGYGLSYTTFSQKIVKSNVNKGTITTGKEKITVDVEVENTGGVAGKEVVQLYFKAPYYEGGIEKAYEVLCAFGKTSLLEPGQKETVKLDFIIQDFASYDFSDANGNGFKGYELDAGQYELSINANAHEVLDSITFNVKEGGIKYETDRYTDHKVENRFSGEDFYSSLPLEKDVEFTQFNRSKKEETKPSHPTIESRTLKEGSRVQEFYTHEFTMADVELSDAGEYIPLAAKKTAEDIQALGWTQQETTLSAASSIQFKELVGLDIDDPKWTEFMNQMTYAEMIPFVTGGNNHNPAISRVGKPSSSDSDGPSKFGAMWWCGAPIVAATFNVDLARQQGDCVGIEGHRDNKFGWAGPGVNLHRSPFGGRNFEYYSADPFLSGRISGRVVAGATDKGIYCFFKHFAVNDQEKNREGVSAFLTEQALRELYLKPFQMVVQEGKVTGIMSSYNRLGLMETAASYPLLTEVLREEWGFRGSIISDMTHNGNSNVNFKCYECINNRVLAGCNNQLDGSDYRSAVECKWDSTLHAPTFKDKSGETHVSYSWWYAVRTMCQQSMWMCCNSGAMQRDFVKEANVTCSGIEGGVLTKVIGDDVDVEINLNEGMRVGDTYDGKEIVDAQFSIDIANSLPAGLELDGNRIVGTCEEKANVFVHVLITLEFADGSTLDTGTSFELNILDVAEEIEGANPIEPVKPGKKGCKGSVTATAILMAPIAAAALALALKKRKE
ncbi:MAG: glycoside hydrolase family 3 C-terminal domain-containing protein [Bacilli bacterium]|nr:glycoside hydrolase family 3 C-terminal domain-containing protein [Bacilli bacterium]